MENVKLKMENSGSNLLCKFDYNQTGSAGLNLDFPFCIFHLNNCG